MTITQSVRNLLLLATVAVAAACGIDVASHRRRREAMRPASYTFEYQRTCFCPASGAWWRITINHDSVTKAELIDSAGVSRGLSYLHTLPQPTLSGLFDEIATRTKPVTAWARVEYDPRWHFPTNARGDAPNRTDSKWTIRVRNFRST